MLDHRQWQAIVSKLALLYGALVVIGWLIGQLSLVLLIASFTLLAININEFNRLMVWLWQTPQKRYISRSNSWDSIYYGVEKIQRENRRRRRQLIDSIGEFRQGADALPDGVTVYGQDHEILWCNRQARLLLGFQWPTDQGQRLDNLIRHPLFSAYLSSRDFEHVLLIPSPINDDVLLENRIIEYGRDQYLLVSRDITHVHQLEQMRREFVANVSHELKTPLTVLQGYLELLNDNPEPQIAPAIGAMEQQAKRMQGLVEQLLSLSKIESGAVAPTNTPVNMVAQLEMIKEDALNLIGERDLILSYVVDNRLDMMGTDTQMFSACSNLITNAIRYCPDGSHIEVSWQRCPGGALFKVSDTGNGIAPHHLNRLTERFYRVEPSRSSRDGGSGLGLSIVKHVLVNHQSNLNITSELNQGSCFSFVISSDRIAVTKAS